MRYHYRKEFGLSETEMEEESWESVRTNLSIMFLYNEKKRLDSLSSERENRISNRNNG